MDEARLADHDVHRDGFLLRLGESRLYMNVIGADLLRESKRGKKGREDPRHDLAGYVKVLFGCCLFHNRRELRRCLTRFSSRRLLKDPYCDGARAMAAQL